MSQVREYVERRELLTNLVLRELRSRYKRSTLGWTWSLLNPLSSVLIYWAVFGVVLKVLFIRLIVKTLCVVVLQKKFVLDIQKLMKLIVRQLLATIKS